MRNEPFKGRVRIGAFSSLQKLMRAARRGKMPDERQGMIDRAIESASKNTDRWLPAHARSMNANLKNGDLP